MWMIFLSSLLAETKTIETLPTIELRIGKETLLVEVADDPHERRLGLMYRKELPEDHGMIFIYQSEEIRGFWMKNTYIPLSIAYVDKNGKILHIVDMQPEDHTSVSSLLPAQYALEVNQGWFEEHDITVGMILRGLP
jgi:uncharacterized protein